MSVAGAQLIGAAFSFIGEMFPPEQNPEEIDDLTETLKGTLSDCMERDEDGRLKMTFTFPDDSALDNMARSFARMINAGKG
jgi:hypothetical protein